MALTGFGGGRRRLPGRFEGVMHGKGKNGKTPRIPLAYFGSEFGSSHLGSWARCFCALAAPGGGFILRAATTAGADGAGRRTKRAAAHVGSRCTVQLRPSC